MIEYVYLVEHGWHNEQTGAIPCSSLEAAEREAALIQIARMEDCLNDMRLSIDYAEEGDRAAILALRYMDTLIWEHRAVLGVVKHIGCNNDWIKITKVELKQ